MGDKSNTNTLGSGFSELWISYSEEDPNSEDDTSEAGVIPEDGVLTMEAKEEADPHHDDLARERDVTSPDWN